MSMIYIREYYGVPARRGGRVMYRGQLTGTIVGSYGAYLRIRMDGSRHARVYHPTWEIVYQERS
jgi:hypothetical protein